MNRAVFYDDVRDSLFGGSLTDDQVSGMEAILDAWLARGITDLRWHAYPLATAKGETAHTMQPIKEYGGDGYFFKMYDMHGDRPRVARALGNTQPGDGVRYCGRGLVQLTGRANYRRMSQYVGHDLEANPDLALRPDIAAKIMTEGMIRGLFTGKSLGDYFNDQVNDPYQARRIINGLDRAQWYADTHERFLRALKKAGAAKPAPKPQPKPPKPAPKTEVGGTAVVGIVAAIVAAMSGTPWWVWLAILAAAAVAGIAIWQIKRQS